MFFFVLLVGWRIVIGVVIWVVVLLLVLFQIFFQLFWFDVDDIGVIFRVRGGRWGWAGVSESRDAYAGGNFCPAAGAGDGAGPGSLKVEMLTRVGISVQRPWRSMQK